MHLDARSVHRVTQRSDPQAESDIVRARPVGISVAAHKLEEVNADPAPIGGRETITSSSVMKKMTLGRSWNNGSSGRILSTNKGSSTSAAAALGESNEGMATPSYSSCPGPRRSVSNWCAWT